MPETTATMGVRKISDAVSIININGEVSGAAEDALMKAYNEASGPGTRSVILDFSGLEYMNSSGIGLLVTLLIRVNRQKQKMLAYGLSEHYRYIFDLTRLNEAIGIHNTMEEALAAA